LQYELKTQVIDPRRKTFAHLIERYGDKPASRYEEGTIGIQATENFHYRPTWAPDKELYDPAYSRFVLTDPDSFTDPRQYYYTPYVTARSSMHEAFGKTLDYLDTRDLFAKLPQAWSTVMADTLVPLRHYESAGQLIYSGATRFGYGTTVTQCCGYAAFDRIGNAQLISRVGLSLGGGSSELLDTAKAQWIEAAHLQGLRKYVEEAMVEEDWADTVISLDLTDQLIYGLMYRALDEAALLGGAGAYSLVAQHLSNWFTDHRRWLDLLYKSWAADPQHGADNVTAFQEVVDRKLDEAVAAVGALAAHIDSITDAGAVASLGEIAAAVRASLTSLGLTVKDA
jgi:phenol/toluene 2-monooxygenase (NADH) P1/A1